MKLKEIIEAKGLKHKAVAKILNIDKQQFSHIVNYKCLPTPAQAHKLCKYLNVDILDIYDKKEITFKMGVATLETLQNDNLLTHQPKNGKMVRCNKPNHPKGV